MGEGGQCKCKLAHFFQFVLLGACITSAVPSAACSLSRWNPSVSPVPSMATLLTVRSRVSSTCSTHTQEKERERERERENIDQATISLTIRSRLSASTLPCSITAPVSFLVVKSASRLRCQLVTATSRQLDNELGSAIVALNAHVSFATTITTSEGGARLALQSAPYRGSAP